jgi:hypothetical protein
MPDERRETTDLYGRQVMFDIRTEQHLARRRPQMLDHVPAILDTVKRPDIHEQDPAPGRERFFRRDLGSIRFLRVVVDFTSLRASW